MCETINLKFCNCNTYYNKGSETMFKKFKRCSEKKRQIYDYEVKQYITKNGINIIQGIYINGLNLKKLTVDDIKLTLGDDFPKAPWIDADNITWQCICLLRHIGYEFEYDDKGNIYFEEDKAYKTIVQNHLKLSGNQILDALSDCCEKTNGRIPYDMMKEILGVHYPKAPGIDKSDMRVGIILFLKETGLPFKFDNDCIYFP